MENLTDQELALAARAGEVAAFDILVRRHAASVYGGTLYAKSKIATVQSPQARMGANGSRNFLGGQAGRSQQGLASGEVLAFDGQSLSLKLSGGSKVVFTSASTTVTRMTEAQLIDITAGANVTVNGVTNADGSITAQFIQIRLAGMAGFGVWMPGQAPKWGAGGQASATR